MLYVEQVGLLFTPASFQSHLSWNVFESVKYACTTVIFITAFCCTNYTMSMHSN